MATIATWLVSSALLAGAPASADAQPTPLSPAVATATIVSPALAQGRVLSAVVETPFDAKTRRLSLRVGVTPAHRRQQVERLDQIELGDGLTDCLGGFPDRSCVAKTETLPGDEKRLIVFVPTATDYP